MDETKTVAWLCEYRNGEQFVSMAASPMNDPDVMSAFPLVMKSAAAATLAARDAEIARLRELLAETLRPGAYGLGSTLAARIDAALASEREAL